MKSKNLNIPRGIRNNNPFNIKLSWNSWKGKISNKKNTDKVFEQFINIDYGLRAGILLLLNAYIRKGFDTPKKIIERYAPESENNTHVYLNFVCDSCLSPNQKIYFPSLYFFSLCRKIVGFESHFDLTFSKYSDIINKFNIR